MRTLKQPDFDEEYHAALHLPNVRFVTKIVELVPVSHKDHAALHLPNVRFVTKIVELIPVSHKDRVRRTWIS